VQAPRDYSVWLFWKCHSLSLWTWFSISIRWNSQNLTFCHAGPWSGISLLVFDLGQERRTGFLGERRAVQRRTNFCCPSDLRPRTPNVVSCFPSYNLQLELFLCSFLPLTRWPRQWLFRSYDFQLLNDRMRAFLVFFGISMHFYWRRASLSVAKGFRQKRSVIALKIWTCLYCWFFIEENLKWLQ